MNITDKLKLAKEAGVKLPHYTNTNNPIDFPQEEYMNEKIEKLAKEAGMVMYPTGLGGIHENTIWGDRNISKFAELIVAECIANVAVWEKDSRNHISDMLKNHFWS